MPDDEEQSDSDDDLEVVSPDPFAAAEANPGKKLVESEGVEGISNLDIKNAIEIVYLDGIKNEAREINKEIQNELRDLALSDSSSLTIPYGISTKIIEINVLTLTYFEGVAFQFLKWGWEIDHELIEVIQGDYNSDLPWGTSPNEWSEETIRSFSHNTPTKSMINAFREVGFLANDHSSLHNVKMRRNKYVHTPEQALDLSVDGDAYPGQAYFEHPSTDQDSPPKELQELAPDETVWEVLTDCLEALDAIEMMVEDHLPIDEELYERLSGPE